MSMGIRLSMFKRILVFFLIGIVIPTVSISTISIYNYSVELKDHYAAALDQSMRNITQQMNALFQELDRFSLQLSLSPSLNLLLRSPDGNNMYDYYVLQDNLINQISINSLIQSEYIYFRVNDRILTSDEGLYGLDTFYDRALIDRLKSGDASLSYQVRDIRSGDGKSGTGVISLERALPLTKKLALGYLVMNIKKEAFFSIFREMADTVGSNLLILDMNSGQTLFRTGNSPSVGIENELISRLSQKPQNNFIFRADGTNYFTSYQIIQQGSWVMVNLIPQSAVDKQFAARLHSTVWTSSVVVGVGLLLSYLFALIIYSPWKDIANRYASLIFTDSRSRSKDEYSMIRQGIEYLLMENKQIKTVTEQMEPLVKFRLMMNLLEHGADEGSLPDRLLEQNGLRFASAYFVVCIVATEFAVHKESNDHHRMRLVLFGLTESVLKTAGEVAGTLLDEGRFAFILGLPEDGLAFREHAEGDPEHAALGEEVKRRLFGLCRSVNGKAHQEFHTGLQFSFGNVYASTANLHRSYEDAKRGLNYKALLSRTDVVFAADLPGKKGIDYPGSLQKMLLEAVKAGNREQAGEAVSKLFRQYVLDDRYPPEKIQHMLIIFLSSLIQELLQDGYTLDELNTGIVASIYECGNNQELERMLTGRIADLIDRLDTSGNRIENLYIAKSIRFMEEHYKDNISIGTIADHVGISPSYLSRIFKSETGKTPLEYLSRHRIECGKRLLLENELQSLQEIGSMIGYPDVQSFIRFFKKYESVTPNVYRKMTSKS